MHGLTKALQGSMLPFSQGWSLSEAILTAGQATADNLPHRLAQIQYLWRTPDLGQAEKILKVLDANAEAAASATHCRVTGAWVSKSRPGLANHALAEIGFRNLELAGPPQFGEDAKAVLLPDDDGIEVVVTGDFFQEDLTVHGDLKVEDGTETQRRLG